MALKVRLGVIVLSLAYRRRREGKARRKRTAIGIHVQRASIEGEIINCRLVQLHVIRIARETGTRVAKIRHKIITVSWKREIPIPAEEAKSGRESWPQYDIGVGLSTINRTSFWPVLSGTTPVMLESFSALTGPYFL